MKAFAWFLLAIVAAVCAADCVVTKTVTEWAAETITCTTVTEWVTEFIISTCFAGQACGSQGLPSTSNIKTETAPPTTGPVSAPTFVSSTAAASTKVTPQATFNPLPDAAIAKTETPAEFNPLEAQSGKAAIINSCGYDLVLNSMGCGNGARDQRIAAGETFLEPIRDCTDQGVALHITSKEHTGPVMVEYSATKQDPVTSIRSLFYDLSFLDCMVDETTDLTGCAGWEQGHQVQGGKGSVVWSCLPNEYCDRTAYTVKEYGQTPENKDERIKVPTPNASTNLENGVVWELCAAKRHA